MARSEAINWPEELTRRYLPVVKPVLLGKIKLEHRYILRSTPYGGLVGCYFFKVDKGELPGAVLF